MFPKREDTLLRGLPGALALLAGIGFVVGIFDASMREQLMPVLLGCLAVAVVGGLVHFRVRRRHTQALEIGRDDEGFWVRVEDRRRGGLTATNGLFVEHTGRRSYPVAWTAFEGADGTVVVRQALGVAHERPSWSDARPPAGEVYVGNPMAIWAAVTT